MNSKYGEWKGEFKHRRKSSQKSQNDHDASNPSSSHQNLNHRETKQVPPLKQQQSIIEEKKEKKKEKAALSSAIKAPPRRHAAHHDNNNSNAGRAPVWFMAFLGAAGVFSMYLTVTHEVSPEQRQRRSDKNAVLQWRRSAQVRCQRFVDTILHNNGDDLLAPNTQQKKERIDQWALQKVQFPNDTTAEQQQQQHSQQPFHHSELLLSEDTSSCKHVFIDLDSGKGDALGAWMELALDVCTPVWHYQQPDLPWMQPEMSRPRFDVETLQLSTSSNINGGDGNPSSSDHSYLLPASRFRQFLHSWLWRNDKKSLIFPEDICILGMENNHRQWTARLHALETFVAGIRPPIFRTFHIVSEEAATGTGEDAHPLAKNMDGQTVTSSERLARILRQVMLPLLPKSAKQNGSGGLLMIRVDLDSSSAVRILQGTVTMQVLCDLRRRGTSVLVLLDLGGDVFDFQERQKTITTLEECGIVFEHLNK